MKVRETWFVLGRKRELISRFIIENSEAYTPVEIFEYGFVLDHRSIHAADRAAETFGIPDRWRFPDRVTPGAELFSILERHEQQCAFAESCTGGLCCAELTEIPGSSRVLWGGWVVYANEAKELLGVPKNVLRQYGAVSKETVLELSRAGLGLSGADWCVSISGIAGPEGGTAAKPVGTVWIGVAGRNERERAFQFRFAGERRSVREKACAAAFLILGRYIREKKKETGC